MSVQLDWSLSPDVSVRTAALGQECEPLIVLDDAFSNPQSLRAAAVTAGYREIGPYYPGLRAEIGRGDLADLSRVLGPFIRDTFGLDPAGLDGECFFSLVTRDPATLDPIQRLPHYDGVEPGRLAVLAYLSEAADAQGGTSFFRHRATGYETITSARFKGYSRALEADVARYGLPEPGYVADGAPIFDRTATVHARFNRLVVYRGHLLHCSATPNDGPLPSDPATGRLTLNAFLWDTVS